MLHRQDMKVDLEVLNFSEFNRFEKAERRNQFKLS